MVSIISGATLEKAVKELNEDPERREEQIKELRERLEGWHPNPEDPLEANLQLARIDDDKFLLCFLRARKFDLDRATTLFVNYFKFRAKYSDSLGELSAQAAETALKSNIVSVLPESALAGYKVLVARFGRINFDEVPLEMMMKMMIIVLDKLIEDEEIQVHGIAFCEDLEGLTFMKMMDLIRKEQIAKGMVFELLQDSFPARFKGFHVVNQPWYISVMLTIVRPFMKQKTKDRLHLHGADYESLHEFLPPSCLPQEFGGELEGLDTYSAATLFSDELSSRDNDTTQ